jgi:putative redox protein
MSETLSASVDLLEGVAFRATTGTGHEVVMDVAPEVGGGDAGPRPMELLLVGLGGCTGLDVISILRKMHQHVSGYQIHLCGERATQHPKIFTSISVEHVVRGRDLSADAVKRAVELSATRYCSAAAMLKQAARIEETYRIVDKSRIRTASGRSTSTSPCSHSAPSCTAHTTPADSVPR